MKKWLLTLAVLAVILVIISHLINQTSVSPDNRGISQERTVESTDSTASAREDEATSSDKVLTRRRPSQRLNVSNANTNWVLQSNYFEQPITNSFTNGSVWRILITRSLLNTNAIMASLEKERLSLEARQRRLAELKELAKLLKRGMTKEEVIAIAGEQPTEQVNKRVDGGIMNYFIFPDCRADPATMPDYYLAVSFLRVVFDANDRTVKWYFSDFMRHMDLPIVPDSAANP